MGGKTLCQYWTSDCQGYALAYAHRRCRPARAMSSMGSQTGRLVLTLSITAYDPEITLRILSVLHGGRPSISPTAWQGASPVRNVTLARPSVAHVQRYNIFRVLQRVCDVRSWPIGSNIAEHNAHPLGIKAEKLCEILGNGMAPRKSNEEFTWCDILSHSSTGYRDDSRQLFVSKRKECCIAAVRPYGPFPDITTGVLPAARRPPTLSR